MAASLAAPSGMSAEPKALQWPAIPQVTLHDASPGGRPVMNAAQFRQTTDSAMALLGPARDRFALQSGAIHNGTSAPSSAGIRSRTLGGRVSEDGLTRRMHVRNVSTSFLQRARYGGEAGGAPPLSDMSVTAGVPMQQHNGQLPRSSSRPLTPLQLPVSNRSDDAAIDSVLEPLLSSFMQDASAASPASAMSPASPAAVVPGGPSGSPVPTAAAVASAASSAGVPAGSRSLRIVAGGAHHGRQLSMPPAIGQHTTAVQAQTVQLQEMLRRELTPSNRSAPRAGFASPPFL